jgi:hypothetical protein
MRRTCNAEDIKYHQSMMPPEAPCGRTYDDLTHLTVCPHDPLPPKLSEAELQELFDALPKKEK